MRATVFHEPDGTITGLFASGGSHRPVELEPTRGGWRCEVELPAEMAGRSLLGILDSYRVELADGRPRLAPAL